MPKLALTVGLMAVAVLLQGCLAAAAVGTVAGATVGVAGAAVGVTAKAAGAVGRAVIPGGGDKEKR